MYFYRMKCLLYVILLFIIASCSSATSHMSAELDHACSMMRTDPSAALEKLNRYDVSQFDDSAVMARWALLYSEALTEKGLATPNDTIIDIAIDYYSRHNLPEELRQANIIKSRMATITDTDDLASALYLQKEKEFFLYKEKTRRQQYVLAGLMILFAATGIIMWQRQRIRTADARNSSLIAEASALRKGLMKRQTEYSALETRLSATLATRFSIIDELCGTYYESQGTKAERKAIADKVKSQIDGLKADDGIFAEMESAVNSCRNDMLTLLRREYPEIKPEEYRLAVYLAGNLSNRTIALLLNENIDVIYKRKSRLKARIVSSGMPHTDLFMAIF